VPVFSISCSSPPVSRDTITDGEVTIGKKLPEEFVSLYLEHDGGDFREDACFCPAAANSWSAHGVSMEFLEPFAEFVEIQENWHDEWCLDKDFISFYSPDAGHCHLCLDYRKSEENPCVTFVDLELERTTPLADSFAEFLAHLGPNLEE
jgi:hypothetical protein